MLRTNSLNIVTFLTKIDVGENTPRSVTHFFLSITGIIKYIDHNYTLILMMICEIASVNDTNGSGDDRLRNDDATSIASYHRHFADWLYAL